ncbi:MAG: segregation/condensation protein A [Firmicutes bacterium]|nr:segregation/condensation protein A [Bacillota bacterium]
MNKAPDICLDIFEGPFDLLVHLIRVNEVDIYDIPIAEITAQYMEYLQALETLDLEIASSFLLMAATLLAIKAKMLLPPVQIEEDEEAATDVRADLVEDLLEYMRVKEAAEQLQGLFEKAKLQFSRPNAEELYINQFAPQNPLIGKTLRDLCTAFAEVLARLPDQESVLDISREQVTIQDKTTDILAALKLKPRGLPFSEVFKACRSKLEYVAAFLALLELIRLLRVRINQSDIYGEIYLYEKQNAED